LSISATTLVAVAGAGKNNVLAVKKARTTGHMTGEKPLIVRGVAASDRFAKVGTTSFISKPMPRLLLQAFPE
jgi:hypothetical protein